MRSISLEALPSNATSTLCSTSGISPPQGRLAFARWPSLHSTCVRAGSVEVLWRPIRRHVKWSALSACSQDEGPSAERRARRRLEVAAGSIVLAFRGCLAGYRGRRERRRPSRGAPSGEATLQSAWGYATCLSQCLPGARTQADEVRGSKGSVSLSSGDLIRGPAALLSSVRPPRVNCRSQFSTRTKSSRSNRAGKPHISTPCGCTSVWVMRRKRFARFRSAAPGCERSSAPALHQRWSGFICPSFAASQVRDAGTTRSSSLQTGPLFLDP